MVTVCVTVEQKGNILCQWYRLCYSRTKREHTLSMVTVCVTVEQKREHTLSMVTVCVTV